MTCKKYFDVTYKDGETRKICLEIHPNDGDPATTAEMFLNDYTRKYFKYMRKDNHKYDVNFSIPDTIVGFPYLIARDCENDAVIGYYGALIKRGKYKGKPALVGSGKSMCALPKITGESEPDKGGRGCHLASIIVRELWRVAHDEYNVDVSIEISNEISNDVYCNQMPEGENWAETGSFRYNKIGERCMIKSIREFH